MVAQGLRLRDATRDVLFGSCRGFATVEEGAKGLPYTSLYSLCQRILQVRAICQLLRQLSWCCWAKYDAETQSPTSQHGSSPDMVPGRLKAVNSFCFL